MLTHEIVKNLGFLKVKERKNFILFISDDGRKKENSCPYEILVVGYPYFGFLTSSSGTCEYNFSIWTEIKTGSTPVNGLSSVSR